MNPGWEPVPWTLVEAAIRHLVRAYPGHRMSPLAPSSQRRAAVAVLLRGDAAGAREVVLIRRGFGAPHHAGELAFPGGMTEPADRDLPATARRELGEELGITKGLWELGCLPDGTAKARTRFTPVVLRWEEAEPRYHPNHEVAAVHPFNLRWLMGAPWTLQTLAFGQDTITVPRLEVEPVPLWGATAFVMKRFLDALNLNPRPPLHDIL